jgi:hypothetical protein
MPILLATAGLVRLLIGKSFFEVDERIGFGGKAFAAYCSAIGDCEDTIGAVLTTLGLKASAVHCARRVSTSYGFGSMSCAVTNSCQSVLPPGRASPDCGGTQLRLSSQMALDHITSDIGRCSSTVRC